MDPTNEALETYFEEETTEETTETLETETAGTDAGGGDPTEDEGGENIPAEGTDGEEPGGAGQFTAEQQAAIAAQTQKQVDAFYRRQYAGFLNPYTQKPIETEADFQAYTQAFEAEEQQRRLAEAGIDQQVLDDYIRHHPVFQQAEQVIREQQQSQANAFMQEEFRALQKEFPDCGLNDPKELYATEAGKKALQMWANTPGVTLADAYAATHRGEISKRQSAAVKQGVLNEMNGKSHLRQTKGGGEAQRTVPADVEAAYHVFFPDATAEEIAEMYWKNQQNEEKRS